MRYNNNINKKQNMKTKIESQSQHERNNLGSTCKKERKNCMRNKKKPYESDRPTSILRLIFSVFAQA
jgi:hypothetical protein